MYFVRDENYTLPRGDLFKSENYEDCKQYLEKWAGEGAQWISDNIMVPQKGNKHFITQIPKQLDECLVMRRLLSQEDAMNVFCKKACEKCAYYKDNKCFIEEVFSNDAMYEDMIKEIMII